MTPDDERRPSWREPERAPNDARQGGRPGDSPGAGEARGGRAPAVSGGEFAGVGLQFAATLLVFLFLGRWLDRHLGMTPWLTIIFLFVGAGGAFYSMYRKLMAAQKRARDEKAGK
jgi:Putative F0F1-ATPase subunit Ca2+/Mg2+ transporter